MAVSSCKSTGCIILQKLASKRLYDSANSQAKACRHDTDDAQFPTIIIDVKRDLPKLASRLVHWTPADRRRSREGPRRTRGCTPKQKSNRSRPLSHGAAPRAAMVHRQERSRGIRGSRSSKSAADYVHHAWPRNPAGATGARVTRRRRTASHHHCWADVAKNANQDERLITNFGAATARIIPKEELQSIYAT